MNSRAIKYELAAIEIRIQNRTREQLLFPNEKGYQWFATTGGEH